MNLPTSPEEWFDRPLNYRPYKYKIILVLYQIGGPLIVSYTGFCVDEIIVAITAPACVRIP
jgi:hypothetical protein